MTIIMYGSVQSVVIRIVLSLITFMNHKKT